MIILVGESASGKSLTERILNKNFGYKKIILYTTRQPRVGELNGVDYYFINNENFNELKETGFFADISTYNGWHYGVPIDQCMDNAILISTPHGLRHFKKDTSIKIVSFYIYVSRRKRLIKILQRGDEIEEAYRRSLTDVGQYDGISDEVDFVIDNSGYRKSPIEIAEEINKLMEAMDE